MVDRTAILVGETGPCAAALEAAGLGLVSGRTDVDVVVIGIGRRAATPIDGSREDALAVFDELVAVGPDGPDDDAARVLVALLAEGPTGRTGETLGAWTGVPLPPRRQRGDDIV